MEKNIFKTAVHRENNPGAFWKIMDHKPVYIYHETLTFCYQKTHPPNARQAFLGPDKKHLFFNKLYSFP